MEDDNIQYESDEEDLSVACQHCGSFEVELKVCAQCGLAHYCSAECQQIDWQAYHKNECADLASSFVGTDTYEEDYDGEDADRASDMIEVKKGRGGRGGRGGRRSVPRQGIVRRPGALLPGGRRVLPRQRGLRTFPRQVYRTVPSFRYPRTRRGGRYFYPGYRGNTGRWLWWSLFGLYPWYRPEYYSYWNSWYPAGGYSYYDPLYLQGRTEPPPELPTFDPNTPPPELDQILQSLRSSYSGYTQRTGYVIIPDYESGRFRWAMPQ
jgi:ribosomal protein L37E